jgi:predicted dehydrogenase
MSKTHKIAIFGCGDFLSRQSVGIKKCENLEVKYLFDPRKAQAEKYATELGGQAVDTDAVIFDDPEIDLVVLFVPPWIRRGLIERACAAGKHIYTTKPLGSTAEDCAAMVAAVEKAGVLCGLGYNRTANPLVEAYKKIFTDPEIGQLALYKQDWLHHYPEWNTWALDPEKNGGPFMDAMIHNQNIARYLMGRPMKAVTYFSDKYAHPELKCGDTEFMKLDFEGNGSAHLFITWAADLAVYSKEGNNREHIDICYMISEHGWRLTHSEVDSVKKITASREGKTREWTVENLAKNAYEQFADAMRDGTSLPADIPGIQEAFEDIKLVRMAEKQQGMQLKVDF